MCSEFHTAVIEFSFNVFKCTLGVGDTVAIDEVLGEIETDKVGNFKVFHQGCVNLLHTVQLFLYSAFI